MQRAQPAAGRDFLLRALRLGQRGVGRHFEKTEDGGVERIDALQKRFDHIHGREFPRPDSI